ncbi:MAG: pantoate--beta-alanine ligase [Proteobacteria bacterium]|nr:pantoate--beta-alanine ligase [Pseudomonadota bacterium]
MQVIETTRALQARADRARTAGRRIALVPTMGALHAGHLTLISEARKRADPVFVSIFVNPTQFNEASDFDQYPRVLEDDLARCREAGVDAVFAPPVAELYPDGATTWVDVEGLTEPLCGASRPGHFRGVTTVVAKLLVAARPHVAVFGEKDFQQLAVVRRMARDLGFDVEIVGVPTVREPDGLALSSRNEHLGPEARGQATALVRALDAAEQAAAEGERDRDRLLAGVREVLAGAPLAEIDYAELRDAETLELAPAGLAGPTVLALAVRFPARHGGDPVRLIDNRVILRPGTKAVAEARKEER